LTFAYSENVLNSAIAPKSAPIGFESPQTQQPFRRFK